jgi:Uma2 family endonuclease
MESKQQSDDLALHALEPWPPNDTGESISGTDLHQTTITNLRIGLNESARIGQDEGQPAPWHASSQMLLLGCRRPSGSYYRTYPDIYVYRKPFEPGRTARTIESDGPPVLIIEVLSESTYEVDLDLTTGKPYSYALAGVLEYMTINPTRQYVPEGIRAWRLVDGAYAPWEADQGGHWPSEQIPVAFALEGTWASVYSRIGGQRMPREGQIMAELAQRDAELARLRKLLEDRR